jgi:hypothetical protein
MEISAHKVYPYIGFLCAYWLIWGNLFARFELTKRFVCLMIKWSGVLDFLAGNRAGVKNTRQR